MAINYPKPNYFDGWSEEKARRDMERRYMEDQYARQMGVYQQYSALAERPKAPGGAVSTPAKSKVLLLC